MHAEISYHTQSELNLWTKKEQGRRMSWKACFLVLVSAFYAVAGYQNDFDGNLYVDCYNNQALYAVESYHDNGREDRRWHFMCKNVVSSPFSHCYWTGYENGFDQPLLFMCNANYVMTGVSSYHDNGREDRRWRFKCCNASGYKTKNCRLTGYINGWDGHMNFHSYSVFAGVTSYHDNGNEDRLWKVLECDYQK